MPLILLSVVVALLMIAGTTTASAAFLAQRDLQAWCDGAALAAAGSPGDPGLYGPPAAEESPAADGALQDYLAEAPDGGSIARLSVQADHITVVCLRTVRLPFGRLFGYSDGLDRRAVSSARLLWTT
jgi:hypothetical protein